MADSDPDSPGIAIKRPRRFRFLSDFGWLALGACLYVLALAVAVSLDPDEARFPVIGPSLWLTPVFGLPYILASFPRRGRLRRVLFFVVLLTAVHVIANYIAYVRRMQDYYLLSIADELRSNAASGAWGGVTGAVLAFTTLYVLRLTPDTRWRLPIMMLGTVALTVTGAAGMALGLQWSEALAHPHETRRLILWFATVHLPWQLVFALFLAWLMPPIRRMPRQPPHAA